MVQTNSVWEKIKDRLIEQDLPNSPAGIATAMNHAAGEDLYTTEYIRQAGAGLAPVNPQYFLHAYWAFGWTDAQMLDIRQRFWEMGVEQLQRSSAPLRHHITSE